MKKVFPLDSYQNPSSISEDGQEHRLQVRLQVESILKQFLRVLPSNYVSQTTGPFYTVQFQAMAEAIAKLQVAFQEAYKDSLYEFTRPEFLWDIIGILVLPKIYNDKNRLPQINGDISYRDFLRTLVTLLLKGTKKDPIEELSLIHI